MSDYTPTTDWVAAGWVKARKPDGIGVAEANAEFDRWRASHDAEVAAKALRDAADALDAYQGDVPDDPRWTCDLGYYGEAEWLRDRANQITMGDR